MGKALLHMRENLKQNAEEIENETGQRKVWLK